MYLGLLITSSSAGDDATPLYFLAKVGDGVSVSLDVETDQMGDYEYQVDNGGATGITLPASIDVSDAITVDGNHAITIDLSPMPSEPARIRAEIEVVG